jgi:hypothetical protein
MTGQKMRALAEALNATRDKDLHLIQTAEGKFDVVEDDEVRGREVILTCKTAADIVDRTVVHTLEGTVGKNARSPGFQVDFFKDHRYDAFFLSEPAVEKFVLPYYARIGKPEEVVELLRKYNKESVYAVAHLPKSIPDIMEGDFVKKEGRRPIHVLAPTNGADDSAEFVSLTDFLARRR